MMKKLAVTLTMLLIVGLMGTSAYATTNSLSQDEVVEVEILINTMDENFAENIIFDDGTKLSDYKYEVTYLAKARVFNPLENYFSYAAWITRDGVVSLSLNPKTIVRNDRVQKDMAWTALAHPWHGFGSSTSWTSDKTFKWQYDCHYSFAKGKTYWNIEPSRRASSYLNVVTAGCNP